MHVYTFSVHVLLYSRDKVILNYLLISFIPVQKKIANSVADCYTDHRLVGCKVAFAFKSPSKRKGPQAKKLQVHKLCNPRVKNNLQVMLGERHNCVTAAEPGEQWKQMKTIIQETTAEVVGLSIRKHQEERSPGEETASAQTL